MMYINLFRIQERNEYLLFFKLVDQESVDWWSMCWQSMHYDAGMSLQKFWWKMGMYDQYHLYDHYHKYLGMQSMHCDTVKSRI